ncbi:MAG: hypothetical protein GWN94_02585 [Phycisphaerae bacterium]|nr:hypothetical protein [Phycisphaerae bacterium]NIS49995.1 hypothetical protein [Phycisphaerae bacterium]NIX29586.1 hypothetical protein [Phycisphaerae bacterium]
MALPKEGAVQAREHAAQNHPDYIKHLNDIDRANEKMLILRNQRATAHTVIDCWRSLNAARNKGQIV